MLHGLGSSKDPLLRDLNKHLGFFRLIAFDLPGHNQSPAIKKQLRGNLITDIADSVIKTLDDLNVKKFALIGFSFGGTVALEIAARYPNRIKALILQGAPYRGAEFPKYQRVLFRFFNDGLSLIGGNKMAWLLANVNMGSENKQKPSKTLKKSKVDTKFWANCIKALFKYDGSHAAQNIKCPLFLIDGAQSPYYYYATTFRVAEAAREGNCPKIKTHLIVGAKHHVAATHVKQFAQKTRSFLFEIYK